MSHLKKTEYQYRLRSIEHKLKISVRLFKCLLVFKIVTFFALVLLLLYFPVALNKIVVSAICNQIEIKTNLIGIPKNLSYTPDCEFELRFNK